MSGLGENLLKIVALINTRQEENVFLAMALAQSMPVEYHDYWQRVFRALHNCVVQTNFWEWDQELVVLDKEVMQLLERLLPLFLEQDGALSLTSFIAYYFFLRGREDEQAIENANHFLAKLENELEPAVWCVLLLKRRTPEHLTIALDLVQNFPVELLFEAETAIAEEWLKTYVQIKYLPQTRAVGRHHHLWRDWEALGVDILLNLVETYIRRSDKALPSIVVSILCQLWQDASMVDLKKEIDGELQQQILTLLSLPMVSIVVQQKVLLSHALFRFTEDPVLRIGGMSGDCDDNVYDCSADVVRVYLMDFKQFHGLLKIETWEQPERAAYRKAIYEIWSYYYLPELETHLKLLLRLNGEDAPTYFYLGQLYHNSNNKQEQAMAYYRMYLDLAPDKIVDNSFFISEMEYCTRCYRPSALEAWTWVGALQEELKQDAAALESYQQGIQLKKDHHQAPYLPWIIWHFEQEQYSRELYQYVEQYRTVFFERVIWDNPKAYAYNIAVVVDEHRSNWIKRYGYLAMYEPDYGRMIGYESLWACMAYWFYQLAEWFYYEQEDFEAALEACLKAKWCVEHQNYAKLRKRNAALKHYPHAMKLISKADILYLQAELAVESHQDYWQAQSLYRKVLKLDPEHAFAKRGLVSIKKRLKY